MGFSKVFGIGCSAMILLSSCASIVSDTSYPVTINSSPSGAKFVVVNDRGMCMHSGRTPSTITLKSGDGYFSGSSYRIKFTKKGFEDKEITVDSSFDGWYVGNVLFGGLIGMLIVDPLTGAMWKLPEHSSVSLNETVSSASKAKSLTIVSINELSEEEKAKLISLNLK